MLESRIRRLASLACVLVLLVATGTRVLHAYHASSDAGHRHPSAARHATCIVCDNPSAPAVTPAFSFRPPSTHTAFQETAHVTSATHARVLDLAERAPPLS